MKSTTFATSVAQAILAYAGASNAYLYNTTIQTKYGPVKGVPALNATCCAYLDGYESVTVWRGIPFAASPGGTNRWKAPQLREPWNSTYVADTFGSACPAGTSPTGATDDVTDEDCLNLNIWTSANSTAEKRPVMIWSYPAGANNAWTMFDGGGLALKDIVVVNYNYRTGPYGWLALPELWEESGNLTTGSYGLLDQIAALKWVHENIRDFGGDPDRITTVGQSAGSAAVYHTVNSPLTKGLIVGAIAESGIREPRDPASTSLAEGYNNMTTSLALGAELLSQLNATNYTLAQLRAIPAETINTASGFTGFSNWRTTLDGYVMSQTYSEQLANGPSNDVPVITGNTKDESGATYNLSTTVADFQSTINSTYGSLASKFLAAYAADNDTQAAMMTNLLARDTSLTGSWSFASRWAKSAVSPFYTYYWDHAPPTEDKGAYHMSEIRYVFNNLYGGGHAYEAVDYEIAERLSSYWANFVKTSNPNKGGSGNYSLPYWAPSSSSNASTFHLAPAAPANANGLSVGYVQTPVATKERIELLEEFWTTQLSL